MERRRRLKGARGRGTAAKTSHPCSAYLSEAGRCLSRCWITCSRKPSNLSVSTLGMMTGTAFVRFMSTLSRAFGHCLDRGYDLIEDFLKKTYPYTSASSSSFTTFALVGAPYCLPYYKPFYALETHIEPTRINPSGFRLRYRNCEKLIEALRTKIRQGEGFEVGVGHIGAA